MQNLSQNELEQIVRIRHIKSYKNMSREELFIVLLKSKQTHEELLRSKDNNSEIEETKKIFKELINRFSKEKIKRIRRKFRFRKVIDEYLKELKNIV